MVEAQLSSQHKHNGTPALPLGTTQVPTPLSSIPSLALSTMEVQQPAQAQSPDTKKGGQAKYSSVLDLSRGHRKVLPEIAGEIHKRFRGEESGQRAPPLSSQPHARHSASLRRDHVVKWWLRVTRKMSLNPLGTKDEPPKAEHYVIARLTSRGKGYR